MRTLSVYMCLLCVCQHTELYIVRVLNTVQAFSWGHSELHPSVCLSNTSQYRPLSQFACLMGTEQGTLSVCLSVCLSPVHESHLVLCQDECPCVILIHYRYTSGWGSLLGATNLRDRPVHFQRENKFSEGN